MQSTVRPAAADLQQHWHLNKEEVGRPGGAGGASVQAGAYEPDARWNIFYLYA